MSRTLRILISLLAMAVALPAIAQVTDDDIDEARREVHQIMSDAQALGDEVQQAWGRQFALDKEISDLAASIDVARARIAETEKKLKAIGEDQVRLRANLAQVPESSAAYKRYLEKFDKQESQIEEWQEALKQKQEAEKKLQAELEAFGAKLTVK